MINRESFTVFYEDNAVNSLALVLCAVTETNDIVITSPTFIISHSFGFMSTHYFFDLCEIG